jgi:hypothetical protein
VDIIDAADAATELDIYLERSYLFYEFPVMTGVLVESGVKIDNLQPFGALFDPLAGACDRIGIEDYWVFGITLSETHYLSIAQMNRWENSKVV